MKKYYKNGKCVQKPRLIHYKGCQYIAPNDLTLLKAGYEIREEEVKLPEVTNEMIKKQRQAAYKATADQYLIAYQAYTELGEHEKAAEMKILWIEERQKIDQKYPYIEE